MVKPQTKTGANTAAGVKFYLLLHQTSKRFNVWQLPKLWKVLGTGLHKVLVSIYVAKLSIRNTQGTAGG